jgi:hypothetical protein
MPVFHRVEEGFLLVTVDGDFTAAEVVRVGGTALEAPDLIVPAFVLLDLSGAAVPANAGETAFEPIATFFAGPRAPVARLAVLATPGAADAIVDAASASGLEARAFQTKPDARAWLEGL